MERKMRDGKRAGVSPLKGPLHLHGSHRILGWPECCLSASCQVTGQASVMPEPFTGDMLRLTQKQAWVWIPISLTPRSGIHRNAWCCQKHLTALVGEIT